MTNEELQAIRDRVDKAREGPWGYVPIEGDISFYIHGKGGNEGVSQEVYVDEDTEFIANARQDIPKLLAEVERLQNSVEYYASPDTWRIDETHFSDAVKYEGDIARQALRGDSK